MYALTTIFNNHSNSDLMDRSFPETRINPLLSATVLLIGLLLPGQRAAAQMLFPVNWEEKPVLHPIADKWKKHSAVIVQDQRRLEYKQESDKAFYVYRTVHRLVRLLDDKGVESFNKFTIPIGKDRKMITLKARTILPGGKVIHVKESAIKTIQGENGMPQYLFAMDGVEKGAEVELIYTERKPFSVFGSETFQVGIPVVAADFSLIAPEQLLFDFGGYNGFPKPADSSVNSLHFYHGSSKDLDAMEEEEYSNADANLQRVDYKMSYVTGNQTSSRRFTWNELVKDLYTKYETFTDKELKIAGKYLQSLDVKEEDEELKKIQKIEDGMKSGINISDDLPDESYEAFDKIISKKLTTEKGFARLMAACLNEAGIRHEFGLTANRYNHVVDEELELWSMLGSFIIYFPRQKMYLAPTAVTYRAPFIPNGYLGNKGIFSKTTRIGNVVSAVPDIRTIDPLPMEQSSSGVIADVTFNTDMVPLVNITHQYQGYSAASYRPVFLFVGKDKEKEVINNMLGLKSKEEDITDYKIEHRAHRHVYSNNPLNVKATLQAPELMEKAGPKYLFKVGTIIGSQQEMYKDEERKQPIDVNYCHTLPRTIRITIPQGYKVVNPDALRIQVTDKNKEGKSTMGFISDYKISGDLLTVDINEFYGQLTYPISEYGIFRKVINAAADFNKVVLVLQKI